MKTSYAVLVCSLLVAIGAFIRSLPSYSVALDPAHFGNLITIIGTIFASWLVKSPQSASKEEAEK